MLTHILCLLVSTAAYNGLAKLVPLLVVYGVHAPHIHTMPWMQACIVQRSIDRNKHNYQQPINVYRRILAAACRASNPHPSRKYPSHGDNTLISTSNINHACRRRISSRARRWCSVQQVHTYMRDRAMIYFPISYSIFFPDSTFHTAAWDTLA